MANFRRARSLPMASDSQASSVNDRDKAEIESLINNIRNGSSNNTESEQSADYKDPFFESPPALGVGSSESEGIWADDDLDAFLESDALLNVDIKSSVEGSNFYIPVSLMVEREQMMRVTAKQFGIGADRWGDSLLYREWRNTRDDASSALEERAHVQNNGDVTVHLNPERDCARSNHSHTLEWKPWLTTCIRAFYNTGTVRIPDDCIGSDILLALEYFGIVYTPDQLVFDSFGAYLRVKLWSEYFTHRSTLAQWVVKRLLNTNAKHSHTFVTSPSEDEGDVLVGSKRADVLDGDLHLDPSKFSGTPCCAVVHDFFHDEDKPEGVDLPLDAMMRDDFAHYVQNSLPGTKVDFSLKEVSVLRSGKTVKRATLHIDFISQKAQPQPIVPAAVVEEKRQDPPLQAKEKLPPLQVKEKLPPRSRSKSPSLFKRIGSGLLKTKNATEAAPEPIKPTNKLQMAPSADHIYDELQKEAKRNNNLNRGRSSVSVDHVYSDLEEPLQESSTHFAESTIPSSEKEMPVEQASAAPYDEHKIGQAKAKAPTTSVAPSDEQQHVSYYQHVRAPIRSTWEGDQVTVASGLTSPFREEEIMTRKVDMAKMFASEPNIGSKRNTINRSSSQRSSHSRNKALSNMQEVDEEIENSDCIQQLLSQEEDTDGNSIFLSSVNNSNFFSSGYTTGTSTRRNPAPMGLQGPQCGSVDVVNSTMCYLFGTGAPKAKPEVRRRNKLPTHPRSKLSDYDAESVAGRGKSAMSVIEAMLPEVNLHRASSDDLDLGDLPTINGRETLESSAAAWLRNAINFNQYIYDDPVPENDDEYLRLARQAGADRPKRKTKIPKETEASTGTLVKEILDGLMSDTSSVFTGSMASTSVSSRSASYTTNSGRQQLVKDSYVPFDPDSVKTPSVQTSDQSSAGGSTKFVPRELPSGQVPPTSSRSSTPQKAQRRRFPTPNRSNSRAPPRSPSRPNDESRNGTPSKQRAMSPLARIPALLPGKKWGRRGEDNSESTPQIKNGNRTVPEEETEVRDSKKSPSRIAGLFRSKGLVRRRSLGEDKGQQKSRSSVASEEYRMFKGKLYNI